MVPVLPCLVLSIIGQALVSLLLTKYRTTNFATDAKINKSENSPILINVCIHRRTVWKTCSYAKYVILLKYRNDYYYYYYYTTVYGRTWRNFKLVRDLIVVLVTCKTEDPIKNDGARMLITLYIYFSGAQGQLTLQSLVGFGRISNSSILLWLS